MGPERRIDGSTKSGRRLHIYNLNSRRNVCVCVYIFWWMTVCIYSIRCVCYGCRVFMSWGHGRVCLLVLGLWFLGVGLCVTGACMCVMGACAWGTQACGLWGHTCRVMGRTGYGAHMQGLWGHTCRGYGAHRLVGYGAYTCCRIDYNPLR